MMRLPAERDPDDPRNQPPILRRDLVAEGWNDRAIQRMVTGGEWVRVRTGAYFVAALWARLSAAERHGVRARAAQLQARTAVALSHVSGLTVYDAPTWGLDLSDVHLTRLDHRAGRREAGVQQHCGVVREGDVVTHNGVLVMHPTRLALEVTTAAGQEPSLVVVNHFLGIGATTLPALDREYKVMERWPRTLGTDLVLRLARPQIESVGETRTFWLLFREGLPLPVPQYEVVDGRGHLIARLDFAWPELGVFLEFDGMVKYEGLLREGERASDVVVREKQREDLVCRVTGWRCIRLTWADLERPKQTAAMIRRVLDERSAA